MIPPKLKWWGIRLGGVFFCYLAFCEFFLITHATGSFFTPLSSLVIIPAANVNGNSVAYRQIVELSHGLQSFGGVEKRKEAFDQALVSSVQRLYVENLADELKVKVTNDELADYKLDLDVINPGLDAAGWKESDYRKFVVEPLLLAQKTEAALSLSPDYQSAAADDMESLRKKLAQGMPLADVAQNFSQDPSALSRGDLGVMSVDDVPEWLRPALALEPGDISGVIEAPDALWTVTMIEFYPSNVDDSSAAVHFRGFAVKKRSLGVVIADMMSENPPWVNVW